MLWKRVQHSWKGGQFNRDLMGRTDLSKYTEAASELENFLVKRTGCIVKRRGTDEIANLTGVVGANAKLIPLAQDRDFGHYVLIAKKKAHLLSRNGILLSDGTWSWNVPSGKSAYGVTVPYGDGELAELDYDQSGDTLFLAHRNHPPAKLERNGDSLTYSTLFFARKKWSKPRVLKVENGGGTWGTGASKTIYYACTYVKDGIESEMSEPVAYTYKLPWGSGCTVNITCNRGNNATEPDYYNIYKKDSTEYGLIACEGRKIESAVSPTVQVLGMSSLVPQLVQNGKTVNVAATANSYVGTIPTSLLLVTANAQVGYNYTRTINHKDSSPTYEQRSGVRTVANYGSILIGGVACGPTVTFSFGTKSGTSVSEIELALDAFEHAPFATTEYGKATYPGHTYNDYDATCAFGGATNFTVKITTSDYNGTQSTFTQTVVVANKMGLVTNAENWYWTSMGMNAKPPTGAKSTTWQSITQVGSNFQRKLKVSFYSDIAAKYGTKSWQTEKIEVTAADASGKACNLYWHGVSFGVSRMQADVFQDDYIKPDLGQTPPVIEEKFDAMGKYPGCVGLYKQRLCFASSYDQPFTFWMSCIGDLYNFAAHDSIRESDGIEATIAATEFPNIRHMIVNRDMLILSDGGEWKVAPVSGNTLSYKTISADKQSAIGSAPYLKPLVIGDEIVFAERTASVLRATRYSVLSEGYESQDLSVLSSDMFRTNPIMSLAYQQSPDSTVWCVLADGTLAALVYMKEHEMVAWSHHTLGGGWEAVQVATNKSLKGDTTETMLLVRRGSDWRLWRFRGDDRCDTRGEAVCLDGVRSFDSASAAGTLEDTQALVTGADGAATVGYRFVSRLVTTRPEADPKEGLLFEIVNATEVEAMVMDASTFAVRAASVDRGGREVELEPSLPADSDEIGLYTGLCRKPVYGDNRRDGRVVVTHEGVWPLTILSLVVTYAVEPANRGTNQQGGQQ